MLLNKLIILNRLIVSVAWVAHIVIYLLIDPPLSAFLNEIFIKLDDVWGKLETYISGFFLYCIMMHLFERILVSSTSRSSGNCSICILLLLSSGFCDCWGNDDWLEVGFYYDPSYEVCIFIVF